MGVEIDASMWFYCHPQLIDCFSFYLAYHGIPIIRVQPHADLDAACTLALRPSGYLMVFTP